MRTYLSLTALLTSTVVVAGCVGGSSNQPVRVPAGSDTSTTETTTTATTYAVGEEAAVGGITHTVVSVAQMDVIPASATLPEWEIIAEDTPAAEGFTWLHIIGEVTNDTKEPQTLTSTGVYVSDADDNQFEVSTDTTIYVDSDKSPIYISLQPTQTIEWDGYFQVPADAEDLVLVGNDLSFLPEGEVRIDLGL
ncbi:MAG: hypothetical protein ACD_41C00174G0002 [uncultured bacterium]|nr:MAG: hypothetical protein ACD_41C00174G0002 [uncultured bacterium]